ncbi:MAG: electron transport complex subunit RsxA [Pseudomonadota bacterium]
MTEIAAILVGTVLVNNVLLVRFLGLCPFIGVSRSVESAIGMALATTFVLTLTSMVSYLVQHYVLVPLELGYLRIVSFILVIALVVQFTELVVRKLNPLLYQVLGIFLPLIASNCAILGITLMSTQESDSLLHATIFGFGAAVGFSLVLVAFSAMRERLDSADVPQPFKGAAIALVTAGFMSLAFMGFAGMAS